MEVVSFPPKVINFIWISSDGKLPREGYSVIRKWEKLYPDYVIRVLRPENYLPLTNQSLYDRASMYQDRRMMSDLARYEVLYREGGYYFDLDFWPVRPFPFMDYCVLDKCLCSYDKSYPGGKIIVNNSVLGAIAGNKFLYELIEQIRSVPDVTSKKPNEWNRTGPAFFLRMVHKHSSLVSLLPSTCWYPWTYKEITDQINLPPDNCYGIHFSDSGTNFLSKGIPSKWKHYRA